MAMPVTRPTFDHLWQKPEENSPSPDLEPIPIPRRPSRRRRRIVDERRPGSWRLSFPIASASGERGWSNCVRVRRPNGGRAGLGGVAGTACHAAGSGVGIRDSWQVAAPVRPCTLCPGRDVACGVREKKGVEPEFRPRSQRAASGRACSRLRWRRQSARPGNRSAPTASHRAYRDRWGFSRFFSPPSGDLVIAPSRLCQCQPIPLRWS